MILTIALWLTVAAATPAPSPAPTQIPLLPIGHAGPGRAICGDLVVHANSAIDSALQGDLLLAHAIARLRSAELEGDMATRRSASTELTRLAVGVSDEAAHGDDEIKRLRELAEKDGTSSRDLMTFDNALLGVFSRQRDMASDLGHLLAYVDYMATTRDLPVDTDPNSGGNDFLRKGSAAVMQSATPPPMTTYARVGSPNRMARAAAADLEARTRGIRNDESTAAIHSEAAVSGC
jgi:hypothetical protein